METASNLVLHKIFGYLLHLCKDGDGGRDFWALGSVNKKFRKLAIKIWKPAKRNFNKIFQFGTWDFIKLFTYEGGWNCGLYWACFRGHIEMAIFMIENGATDWNLGLHGACDGGYLEIAVLMIEKGATKLNEGLCCACIMREKKMIQYMIQKGARRCFNCGKTAEDHLR